MATAEAIPEPIPDRSDVQKYIRFAVLDRVAHVGMMLDKIQRQNRRAERYELFAATGDVNDLKPPADEADDMGVNIGNETHYHISTPSPSPAVPAPTETATAAVTDTKPVAAAATAETATQKKSKWWPLLIGGVLLGTAAGAGGGYIVHDWLKPEQSAGVDTDTITELDFAS